MVQAHGKARRWQLAAQNCGDMQYLASKRESENVISIRMCMCNAHADAIYRGAAISLSISNGNSVGLVNSTLGARSGVGRSSGAP